MEKTSNQITSKVRNGTIDILRFLFALAIMIQHYSSTFHSGICIRGSIGVEFFFIVTGFLMACNAKNKASTPNISIPDSTWRFILNKIKSFYPYYFVAVTIRWIYLDLIYNYKGLIKTLVNVLKTIPTLTLTFYVMNWKDNYGVFMGAWYLSAMIICLFILYPLLLSNYLLMTEIIFPISSLFILGILYEKGGHTLALHTNFLLFCPTGIWRGIAEISLGACLKPLVDKLNNFEFSKLTKFCFTLFSYMCFIAVFLYILFGENFPCDLPMLLLICSSIVLIFSNHTYQIKGNNFTNLLGKLSLTVYIFHGSLLSILSSIIKARDLPLSSFFLLLGFVVLLCCLLSLITDWIVKLFDSKKRICVN